ncbi:MAG: bifunctional pyr operon transcriptional regulator/uracil phosphoribosyltransferase PyrR [Clostridia bacterium]|nr:bifunctional pyr operon transcriptional regulator/uracil phosphoribosyltransferase PyrR [Clostridia bacterium]
MKFKAELMDENSLRRAVVRMSHEILEKNGGTEGLCLCGIKRRGVPLAEMIRDTIFKIEGAELKCTSIDVAFYRDDLSRLASKPIVGNKTDFDVEDKTVVLVDDVIYTGRTVRAALDALVDLGRPAAVRLAVLIDRGHRELPIKPDFVGKNVPTSRSEVVEVMLPPFDDRTGVVLMEKD